MICRRHSGPPGLPVPPPHGADAGPGCGMGCGVPGSGGGGPGGLRHFNQEAFYYSLRPPRLGDNLADDFLFETRNGFCEHYASSFALLMRIAGIPARIVMGFLGGERNPLGAHLIVRQSDAHAWVEVWLDGQGWTRIDPTAAVAPERIEPSPELTGLASGRPLRLRIGGVDTLGSVGPWLAPLWRRPG